ncbi:hypothetical protein FAQ20_19275 [Morganella morganii]|nr:hypothetical protein [Morganella morganii]EGT3624793.1 hypothetical protein [Morganella morganii]EGT3632179.1 hypothetical protein [Morganella morganii]EGT3632626.1 hypothetical protein [Morganella morganii]EGT3633425.1 hypothetical protein [Morganella morganii]
MHKQIFRELFKPDSTSVLARWTYFIANLWLGLFTGLAVLTMPVYPDLLGFPYSSFYFFSYIAVASGIFLWCSVNILAKRLRDIGFTMACNAAILYTVIDLLLIWQTDYLIVDLISIAITIMIMLIPAGYLNKKEISV